MFACKVSNKKDPKMLSCISIGEAHHKNASDCGTYCTCLGYLGQRATKRNLTNLCCIFQGNQGKYYIDLMCMQCVISLLLLLTLLLLAVNVTVTVIGTGTVAVTANFADNVNAANAIGVTTAIANAIADAVAVTIAVTVVAAIAVTVAAISGFTKKTSLLYKSLQP